MLIGWNVIIDDEEHFVVFGELEDYIHRFCSPDKVCRIEFVKGR
ncbi:hypothetical protein [Suicoccus acidiformans]|nr:hypothetical protein [Suicoccus acidiformans]